MPTYTHSSDALADADVDLLVVGARKAPSEAETDEILPPLLDEHGAALADRLDIDLATVCAAAGFDGEAGTSLRVPTRGAVGAPMVLVVGLGSDEAPTADALRRAAALVGEATQRLGRAATTLHLTPGLGAETAARAVVEGLELGAYRFLAYKTAGDTHELETVLLCGGDAAAVAAGIRVGGISAAATSLVRDLGNTPSADKRPPALAERARELVAELPIEVEVLDEAALRDGGYGGHLGVAAGSSVEPRFVELRYRPSGASRHVALVGKGITFDSGGLSLKPPKSMEWMKIDMAGAATVLATVRAAAELELPVAVTGLLCLAENMPSGSATRPGDVLTIKGGQTVEVLNTDAEGRLVLADGLVHASELQPTPDAVVDLATLTGAAIVALGPRYSGLMSNDDDLADALLAAARAAGEPCWRLPLATDEYGEELKSEVADLRNLGGAGAGTIRAALFLSQFVGDGLSWAHLDIAGASWNDEAPYGYVPKGATGIPARTLLDWLRGL